MGKPRKSVSVKIVEYVDAGVRNKRGADGKIVSSPLFRPVPSCGHYSYNRYTEEQKPKRNKMPCRQCFRDQERKREQEERERKAKAEQAAKLAQQLAAAQLAQKVAQANQQGQVQGAAPAPAKATQQVLKQLKQAADSQYGAKLDPNAMKEDAVLMAVEGQKALEKAEQLAKVAGGGVNVNPDLAGIQASIVARKMANADVGDFISELITAIKIRQEYDLTRGELLVDPVRGYTDGRAFSNELRHENHGKLRIAVVLDTSSSMFGYNGKIWDAAPVFHKMDVMLRDAKMALPQGVLSYAPFVFHSRAVKLARSFVPELTKGAWIDQSIQPRYPTDAEMVEAYNEGEIEKTARHDDFPLSGGSTILSGAFRAIQEWEQNDSDFDQNAVRIDIILTDGEFDEYDVKNASEIQVDRNGKLITVLLNFNGPDAVQANLTPERSTQYPVSAENLTERIRSILEEGVAALNS